LLVVIGAAAFFANSASDEIRNQSTTTGEDTSETRSEDVSEEAKKEVDEAATEPQSQDSVDDLKVVPGFKYSSTQNSIPKWTTHYFDYEYAGQAYDVSLDIISDPYIDADFDEIYVLDETPYQVGGIQAAYAFSKAGIINGTQVSDSHEGTMSVFTDSDIVYFVFIHPYDLKSDQAGLKIVTEAFLDALGSHFR